jgi:phosphoribosyl-ATP pyrophosphohydrolase/phosphoribosyl-AMP cyclohydrolase
MISHLQAVIQDRQANPQPTSYTNQLLAEGLPRIAQKVGEEGVEVVVAALAQSDEALLGEVADWVYHTSVLLVKRGLTWEQVEAVLQQRHAQPKGN